MVCFISLLKRGAIVPLFLFILFLTNLVCTLLLITDSGKRSF